MTEQVKFEDVAGMERAKKEMPKRTSRTSRPLSEGQMMSLLRMRSRKDGATITYIIEVSNGAECWAVIRRYSEFRRCHVQLQEYFAKSDSNLIPPFPPKEPVFKKLLGGTEEHSAFLRTRESDLQTYLGRLLQHPGLCRSPPVQMFLDSREILAYDDIPSEGDGSAASSGMHHEEEEAEGAASFSGFRVRLTGEPGGLEVVIRAGSHADTTLRPTVVHLSLQELADEDGRLGSAKQRLEEVLEFLDSSEVKKRFSLPPGTLWEVSAYGTTAKGLASSAVSLRVRAPGNRELADLPASAIASFSSSERERGKEHARIPEASTFAIGKPVRARFEGKWFDGTISAGPNGSGEYKVVYDSDGTYSWVRLEDLVAKARDTLKCIGCSEKMAWCAGHCGEGGYVGGQFVCNNGSKCKNASGPLQQGFRWNCPSCSVDFCGACESHQATIIDNPQSAEQIAETVDEDLSLAWDVTLCPKGQRHPRFAEGEEEFGGEEIQDGGNGKVIFQKGSPMPLGPEDHRILSARGKVAATYLNTVEEKSLQSIEKAPYRFEAVDGEKRTVPLRFSAKSMGNIEDASQERKDAEVLDQTRRRMELSKLQKEEQNAAAWLSEVTGHPDVSAAARGETTLQAAIQSGEALCDLINAVWPERIIGILRGEVNTKRRVDNIQKFCKACREAGVEEAAIFAPLDVAMGSKDMNVLPCLLALNAVLPPEFEGVRLTEYIRVP